jgi:hypothetical protein
MLRLRGSMLVDLRHMPPRSRKLPSQRAIPYIPADRS